MASSTHFESGYPQWARLRAVDVFVSSRRRRPDAVHHQRDASECRGLDHASLPYFRCWSCRLTHFPPSSAKDQLTGASVAVKKIMKPFSTPVLSKRTYRELKLLKHIQHENVSCHFTSVRAFGRRNGLDLMLTPSASLSASAMCSSHRWRICESFCSSLRHCSLI